MPLTEWGRSGEEIDTQIRFLLAVDKQSGFPLYFRSLPGNIVDVSAMQNTISELKQYGVNNAFVYSDAGFFSEDNIKELYANEIQFLTRLPATRTIYRDLIHTHAKNLESLTNGVRYGKRSMFIKQTEIELFGRKAYAHVVLDPKRKGREVERLVLENLDEKESNADDLEYQFLRSGVMILVSSFSIPKEDVVPAYYVRQTAEMLFGFSKDDLNILPLRVHNQERTGGFLLVQFLCLIAFIQVKQKLGKEFSVEEILVSLRNLKAKVYEKTTIVGELTKEHKEITKILNVIMPKTAGI
jgi:transposase